MLRQLRGTSVAPLTGPASPSDNGGRAHAAWPNVLRLVGFPVALALAVAFVGCARRRAWPAAARASRPPPFQPRNSHLISRPGGTTMLTISPRRNLAGCSPPSPSPRSGCVVASPADAALPGASALLTRAPYLTDLTQTSVQVSWATSAQNTGVVQYGPPGNCTANSVAATSRVPRSPSAA